MSGALVISFSSYGGVMVAVAARMSKRVKYAEALKFIDLVRF